MKNRYENVSRQIFNDPLSPLSGRMKRPDPIEPTFQQTNNRNDVLLSKSRQHKTHQGYKFCA